jgi:hypothetical protein
MKNDKNPYEDYEHSVMKFWTILLTIFLVIIIGAFTKCQGQTKQEVYDYCIVIGIHNPEFVTAQVLYETGHLNPEKLGMRNKNLLCFRWGSFLKFDCWQASLNYYKCWMERKGIYHYKDFNTLLINEWKAEDMNRYVRAVESIKRDHLKDLKL